MFVTEHSLSGTVMLSMALAGRWDARDGVGHAIQLALLITYVELVFREA